MQSQTEADPTHPSQWNVVTGQVNSLEPIVTFEVTKAVLLFFAIGKVFVHEKGDRTLGTGSDRLRKQGVRRGFVFVLDHRENMQYARMRSRFVSYEFDETNHGPVEEGSAKDATIEKGPCIVTGPFNTHPIVREPLSLADGAFIVNPNNSIK